MTNTKTERIASVVVLASIVTVVLIADIVGTAASTSRLLGAFGLLSLFGLLRHGYRLIRDQQFLLEMFRTSDRLQAEQELHGAGEISAVRRKLLTDKMREFAATHDEMLRQMAKEGL